MRGSLGEHAFGDGSYFVAVTTGWWAFGDETFGDHYGAVLGYVASPRQWKKFRIEWKDALKRENVEPEFHAIDFFRKQRWQSADSPYHKWTDVRAKSFLERLLDAIHRYDLRPIGWVFNIDAFMRFSEHDRKLLTGATNNTRTRVREGEVEITDKLLSTGAPNEPYFVGWNVFITDALKLAPADVTVNYMFDSRENIESRAGDAFREIERYSKVPFIFERLGMLEYDHSLRHPELQAADLYNYITNRGFHDSLDEIQAYALESLTRKRRNYPTAEFEDYQELLAGLEDDRQAGITQATDRLRERKNPRNDGGGVRARKS